MPPDLEGQRVTVMGLGRFGGGVGVTRWLAGQGARVLVTDREPAERLGDSLRQIDDLVQRGDVTLRLGEHNVSDFTTADLVVANPAVPKPWDDRFLRSAQAANVPITTEIRLLVDRIDRQRVIGVTGSAGKSTTAAMIHHMLMKSDLAAHLGGNIGGSLLNAQAAIGPRDWIVLELSSAMLYWLGEGAGYADAEGWSPRVAVLTNIDPNHIDWHGSFEHYRNSKLNIFKYQRDGDIQVRGEEVADDTATIALKIPGRHNQANARLALAVVHRVTGLRETDLTPRLADFAGLPHRLQLVAERDGRRYFNDSKSTTPQATVLAVQSFDDPAKVHLIAGGYDKGSDLSPIAALAPDIAGLYAIGVTGEALASNARAKGGHAERCEALDSAAERAMQRMRHGDVLLLSPGCASWDQFINFEKRGEEFVRLVSGKR